MPRVQVAEGIHRLTQGVVNFYLIEDGGRLALVDANAPGHWNVLVRMLGSLGRTLADLECVVLTHAHNDHTGFAEGRVRRRTRRSGSTKSMPRSPRAATRRRTNPASAGTSCVPRRTGRCSVSCADAA
jgi:glyoxylase-like metal-dependent hydrolase (beta-lactamase superfamily II)